MSGEAPESRVPGSVAAVRPAPVPIAIDPGRIRAVVFDLFGTLVPGTPMARRAADAAATARILGVDPEAFHALLHVTFTERATGAMGDEHGVLRTLASRLGVVPSPGAVDAAADLRRAQLASDLVARPDAVPTLARLRAAGYRLGLVSDCGPEVPAIWTTLPLAPLVDATVFSSEVGCRKPDASLYRRVCRELGVEPQACLYVGDGDSHELTGATRVGMAAVRLGAEDATAVALVHYDHDTAWRGPSVPQLADVPKLLGLAPPGPGDVGGRPDVGSGVGQ